MSTVDSFSLKYKKFYFKIFLIEKMKWYIKKIRCKIRHSYLIIILKNIFITELHC